MNEDLIVSTKGHDDLRGAVRDLCSDFDLSYWERCDREHRYPREFYKAFSSAGWLGMMVPTEFGGGGAGLSETCAVMEEVAAAGGAFNACTTVHTTIICLAAIVRHGSAALKERYLGAVASGEMFMSFGVTEPDAGSDTTRITTRATKVGDKYIVDGRKTWNSGALEASKVLLLVRTSPYDSHRRTEGMSLLLADLQVPSVEIRPIAKIGRNAVDSNEVFFDNLPVDASDLVGEEGKGFRHLLDGLNAERIMLAAENIGIGRWALAAAVDYANSRKVFDRFIGSNQSVQHPLAEDFMHLSAAAEMVDKAARAYDNNEPSDICGPLANMCKYLASEAACNATDHSMQTHGGYSFAREYHIGRYWIESRLQRIAPLNDQMLLNYMSERVLGLPRSY